MKRLLLIVSFLLFSLGCFAQIETHPSVSTSQIGGQFEIIQSPLARKLTFKLDKYCGYVWQLVLVKDNSFAWQPVVIFNLYQKYPNHDKNEEITYQIVMGGKSVQDCFLVNIKTGDTWQLKYSEEYDEYHFHLIE